MTRLQKKCLIATAGTHLLAVVLLFCSGFILSKPKPDETQLLDMIPANVIEAAFNSGVKNAPKPAPQPVTPPEPRVEKLPPPEPPKPEKTPEPEPLTPPEKIPEADPVPAPKPKPPHVVKPNLARVVIHPPKPNVSKPTEPDTSAEEAVREEKRLKAARLKAIRNAARNISDNSSSATTVEMPGTGSVSYANYASVVKSIYEREWQPPDDAASDDANTKVSVTIASDGRVLDAHIINPSGDAKVDASVRRTLDRVTTIREFPDGAKEREKTFIINFNLKAKRMSA